MEAFRVVGLANTGRVSLSDEWDLCAELAVFEDNEGLLPVLAIVVSAVP